MGNYAQHMDNVWRQGYNARVSLGVHAHNPYVPDTEEHAVWADGFLHADRDEFDKRSFQRLGLAAFAVAVAILVVSAVLHHVGAFS